MRRPPIPDSDPSHPAAPSADVLSTKAAEDGSYDTDIAEFAASIAAQTDGGLFPDFSDLALEIVLNEIVAHACLAVGVTGAAVMLKRDGNMICHASCGSTAPKVGDRLDASSGLTGECVKKQQLVRCDDILESPQVEMEPSQRFGARSVILMPLLLEGELAGIFELLSSQPSAFGERDERTLEALAMSILNNLQHATPSKNEQSETALPLKSRPPEDGRAPRRLDFLTFALALTVVACTLLLGVLVARRFGLQKTTLRAHLPAVVTSAVAERPLTVGSTSGKEASLEAITRQGPFSKPRPRSLVPPGGMVVFEKSKEVFRVPPTYNQDEPTSADPGGGAQAASGQRDGALEISPAAIENDLLDRVKPNYPVEARQQNIQGTVVLQLHTAADGTVHDVQVVSGPPQLAQAASDAVKKWRFKARTVNGRQAEAQTTITLKFTLPH